MSLFEYPVIALDVRISLARMALEAFKVGADPDDNRGLWYRKFCGRTGAGQLEMAIRGWS